MLIQVRFDYHDQLVFEIRAETAKENGLVISQYWMEKAKLLIPTEPLTSCVTLASFQASPNPLHLPHSVKLKGDNVSKVPSRLPGIWEYPSKGQEIHWTRLRNKAVHWGMTILTTFQDWMPRRSLFTKVKCRSVRCLSWDFVGSIKLANLSWDFVGSIKLAN